MSNLCSLRRSMPAFPDAVDHSGEGIAAKRHAGYRALITGGTRKGPKQTLFDTFKWEVPVRVESYAEVETNSRRDGACRVVLCTGCGLWRRSRVKPRLYPSIRLSHRANRRPGREDRRRNCTAPRTWRGPRGSLRIRKHRKLGCELLALTFRAGCFVL